MDRPDESALLLIGHGSRMPHNKDVVEGLARIIREKGGWKSVSCCFLEYADPPISKGLAHACTDRAVITVVCIPVLIAAGAHLVRDIPRQLGIEEGKSAATRSIGGVVRTIMIAEALGADSGLAALLDRRGRDMLGT